MNLDQQTSAIYLVGHGPLHKPRLIELQYWRVMRYRAARGETGPLSKVFLDPNLPRSPHDPQQPEDFPAFMELWQSVRAKNYGLVFMDLEDGSRFNPGVLKFVRVLLEEAGAKVLNAFYDDEQVFERMLKSRFGKRAQIDDVTDGSDMTAFFPGLTSEILIASLRLELQKEDLPNIGQRIDTLRMIKPYASGRTPFVEDRLSWEWNRGHETSSGS